MNILEIITAIATLALAVIAFVALRFSIKQIEEGRRIGRIQATMDIMKEAETEAIDGAFWLFHVGLTLSEGRSATNKFYSEVVIPTRTSKKAVENESGLPIPVQNPDRVRELAAEIRRDIIHEFGSAEDRTNPSDAFLSKTLKTQVMTVTGFCERVYVLLKNDVVDRAMILELLDYKIAATYEILRDVLQDLARVERFEFEDVRQLSLLALKRYKERSEQDDELRVARFDPLA